LTAVEASFFCDDALYKLTFTILCVSVHAELPGLKTLAEISAKYQPVKDGDDDDDDDDDVDERPPRGFDHVCISLSH